MLEQQIGNLNLSRDELNDVHKQFAKDRGKYASPDVSDMDYTAMLIQRSLEISVETDSAFWNAIRCFVTRRPGPQYIPLFAQLFELAKGDMRAVYWVGRYLYSHRTVRLDPVNEVFYLDALMAYGRTGAALSLWRSRLGREDTSSGPYWLEVGALYHIQAHLIVGAEAITRMISQKFQGYIPPRVSMGLALEHLRIGDQQAAGHWIKVFQETPLTTQMDEDLMEKQGITESIRDNFANHLMARRLWTTAASIIDSGEGWEEGLKMSLLQNRRAKLSKLPRQQEESITPVLEKLSGIDPERALNPLFHSALLANLARRHQLQELKECLDEIEAFSGEPIPFASTIVRELSAKDAEFTKQLVLKGPLATPTAQGTYLKVTGDATNLPLSEPVARQLLLQGNPGKIPVESLALSPYCWRLIWHLVRTGQSKEIPMDLVKTMSPTDLEWLGVLEAVLQGFAAHGDFVGALAVCHSLGPIDRIVASSFLQFVQCKVQNRTTRFGQPGLNDRKSGGDMVSAATLSRALAKILRCNPLNLSENARRLAPKIKRKTPSD